MEASAGMGISEGGGYTVGLGSDGTMVAVGRNDDGQCEVSDWHLDEPTYTNLIIYYSTM